MSDRPKEMDMAIQSSYADGGWHITIQAWIKTPEAADKAIKAIETLKPLLTEPHQEAAQSAE